MRLFNLEGRAQVWRTENSTRWAAWAPGNPVTLHPTWREAYDYALWLMN